VPGEYGPTAPRRDVFEIQERAAGVVSACFAMVPPACLLLAQVGVYAWQEDD
jgi:hypothetical protein